jgi:hypothetical protein
VDGDESPGAVAQVRAIDCVVDVDTVYAAAEEPAP